MRLALHIAGDKLSYRAETTKPVRSSFTEGLACFSESQWSPEAGFDRLRASRPHGLFLDAP
jgi:hypothetical protein